MRSITETLVVAAAFVALAAILAHCTACASTKAAEAEASYLGQQLKCVDQSETRAEADACRAKVREAWGITETVTIKPQDAGDQ